MAFFSVTSTPEDKLRTLAGSADELLKDLDRTRQENTQLKQDKAALEHTNRILNQQLHEAQDKNERLSFAVGMRTSALDQAKRALGVMVYAEQRVQQYGTVQSLPESTAPVKPDPQIVARLEKLNGDDHANQNQAA